MKQFTIDPNWKMEAGSESKETHIQLQRESLTVEAIYFQSSDIPANPFVASDALDFDGDDSSVPIVPLDVINDKTSPDGDGIPPITSSPTVEVGEATLPLNVPPLGPQETPEVGAQPLFQRDEVIGTAVALVALIKSKEPGNQIDLELLIQLLRNPGMLEQLMKERGLSANQRSRITYAQPQIRSSVPLPVPRPTLEVRPAKSEVNLFVTQPTPLSVPELIFTKNLAKVPASVQSIWPLSVPFSYSMSQEVKDMIEGILRKSGGQSNESMPVARLTSVPSPSSYKFDASKVRKLIDEYGVSSGSLDDSAKPGNLSSPSAAKPGRS